MNANRLKPFLLFTAVLTISILSLFATKNHMEQLHEYFINCEYAKAIETAGVLLKDPKLTNENRKTVYILKGISEFSSNQILNARITFTDLLMYDKNVNLNTKEVSPKIIDFFNELKKNLMMENL